MDNKIYDVVILGGGPAGLAAGLYAGRSRLSVLILERGIDGGHSARHSEAHLPGSAICSDRVQPDLWTARHCT